MVYGNKSYIEITFIVFLLFRSTNGVPIILFYEPEIVL